MRVTRAWHEATIPAAGEDAIGRRGTSRIRYGLPKWQFTLSAPVPRRGHPSRPPTSRGRELVCAFDGKYPRAPRPRTCRRSRATASCPAPAGRRARPDRTGHDQAGIIRPDRGSTRALRRMTREHGMFARAGTRRTHSSGRRGDVGELALEPEPVHDRKSRSVRVPLGAYGDDRGRSPPSCTADQHTSFPAHWSLVATGGP
jgi:hypothetical protein